MTARPPDGRSAVRCTAPRAAQACRDTEPMRTPVLRRERAAVAGGRPGRRTHTISPAGHGHDAPPGHTVADHRRATLRPGVASLTQTAGRAPFEHRDPAAGEGAR